MACTEAVETEIDRHYGQQLDELGSDDPELAADIAEFRADESSIATSPGTREPLRRSDTVTDRRNSGRMQAGHWAFQEDLRNTGRALSALGV